ncbi:MAG: hypothetical protein ACOYLV_15855, partial [Rubrivivax sp.]
FAASGASLTHTPPDGKASFWVPETNTIHIHPLHRAFPYTLIQTFVHEIGHTLTYAPFEQQVKAILSSGVDIPTMKSQITMARGEMELRADLLNVHFGLSAIYVVNNGLKSMADRLWQEAGGDLEVGMITHAMVSEMKTTGRWGQWEAVAEWFIDNWPRVAVNPRAGDEYNSPQALNHLMRLLVNFDLADQNRHDPFANTKIPDWVKNCFRIHTPNNPYGPSIQA